MIKPFYITKNMIHFIIMNTDLELTDIKVLSNNQIINILKVIGYYDD